MTAPAIRQSAGNGSSASLNNITQALSLAVLAGSRLYAYIVWGSASGVVQSVSDTINGTTGWVKVPNSNASESAGPTQGEWWVNPNSAAGAAPTITATFGNGSGTATAFGFRAIVFGEITDSDPTEVAAIASAKAIATSTTTFTSNGVIVPNDGSLILGGCSNDVDGTVPSAGSGFTIDKTTTTQVIGTESEVQATHGGAFATFTFASAVAGIVSIVALSPAPVVATAAITGTATPSMAAADVVAGGKTIVATLSNETFVPASGSTPATLQYVGSAVATGNSAAFAVGLTALTGGIDTAARTNDLVIIASGWVSTADGNPGPTTTGYTEIADLYSNDTRDANLSVAYKFMGATPDTSCTVAGSGSTTNGAVAVAHVWRNVDQTTPMDVTAVPSSGAASPNINGSIPDAPAITPVSAGAVVVAIGGGTSASVLTGTAAPTGYSNFKVAQVDPGSAFNIFVASKAWSGSGAEDPAAFAGTGTSTSDSWAALTLALRPASIATTPFASAIPAIITGLLSAQSETHGWNNAVRSALTSSNVVRTSNTVCTITLPAVSTYSITADETITVTLPASALTGGNAVTATPTFSVTAPASGTTYNDTVAETGAAADTPSGVAVFPKSVIESGAAADGPAVTAVVRPSLIESGAATDAPVGAAVLPNSVAESGAVADTPSATATVRPSLTESGAVADADSVVDADVPAVTEALAATDSQAAAAVVAPSVAESGAAVDTTIGGLAAQKSITETLAAAESLTGAVAFAPALTESGAATDSPAATAILRPSVTETGAAVDTPVSSGDSVAEALAATDTPAGVVVARPSLTESGAATDSRNATATVAASVTDTGAAADTVTGVAAHPVSLSESGAASDAPAVTTTTLPAVVESGAAADAPSAAAVMRASLTESGAAADVVTGTAGVPIVEALNATDAAAVDVVPAPVVIFAGGGVTFRKKLPYWMHWKFIPDWMWQQHRRDLPPNVATMLPASGGASLASVSLIPRLRSAAVRNTIPAALTAPVRIQVVCLGAYGGAPLVKPLRQVQLIAKGGERQPAHAALRFAGFTARAAGAQVPTAATPAPIVVFTMRAIPAPPEPDDMPVLTMTPLVRSASEAVTNGQAVSDQPLTLAVFSGDPRSLTVVRRDLRSQISGDHPTWPSAVVDAEVDDAMRGKGLYVRLARELRYRSLKALRKVDRQLRQRAGVSRRMIRFDKLVRTVSDRYDARVAAEWLRAVSGWRRGLDMRAIRAALKRGDVAAVERMLKVTSLQKTIEVDLARPLLETIRAAGQGSTTILQGRGFAATFDAARPDVAAIARRQGAKLVKDIPRQTRQVISEIIAMGQEFGLTPDQQARAIREVITLPPNWAGAPVQLAEDIRRGRMGRVSARYLSAADQQRIRSRINNGTVTESFVEEMQAVYAKRLTNLRAQTIARQETQMASHQGLLESWDQAGLPKEARKFWLVTPDERLCPICRAIPRLNPKGRKLDEPFATPRGPVMFPPMSHVKCRCSMGLAFGAHL